MNTNKFSLITLTTDFGLEDEYAGLMKGVIRSIHPDIPVVDLTHHIPPHDLEWTAYMIYYGFQYFPEGSIHVIVVDPGVGSSRQIKFMEAAGHYFLFPDNGLITKVYARYEPEVIWSITNREYYLEHVSNTFHGRDIFAPVAAHLSKGIHPSTLGVRSRELNLLTLNQPQCFEKEIVGHVIHVDRFGNLITNIESKQVNTLTENFEELTIYMAHHTLKGIAQSYSERDAGEPLAIIGSRDLLEVAVNKKLAASFLGCRKGDEVRLSLSSG